MRPWTMGALLLAIAGCTGTASFQEATFDPDPADGPLVSSPEAQTITVSIPYEAKGFAPWGGRVKATATLGGIEVTPKSALEVPVALNACKGDKCELKVVTTWPLDLENATDSESVAGPTASFEVSVAVMEGTKEVHKETKAYEVTRTAPATK